MASKKFKLKLEPLAKIDIQEIIHFYNEQQKGLGKKFYLELDTYFKAIRINPFYQNRYDEVKCLPLKKFPVMIHFTVHEVDSCIKIRAVLNTFRDPKNYWK
jgi:toxin ParE1/3/4